MSCLHVLHEFPELAMELVVNGGLLAVYEQACGRVDLHRLAFLCVIHSLTKTMVRALQNCDIRGKARTAGCRT